MQLPYSDELNVEYLGRLFDNKSESYKLFWFKAVLKMVTEGKVNISYEELIDEMIADAWYMVSEYHLNLGPADNLEKVVKLIKEKYPEVKSNEKKEKIIELLNSTEDRDIKKLKKTLTLNVPYRLQAPFMPDMKGESSWKCGEQEKINKINQQERLMYYFSALNGLKTEIHIQDDWAEYLTRNQEIIRGWIEFNMITYLQRRNPSVPGISDKLRPPMERKLENVKKYWKTIIAIEPIREIYTDTILTESDVSIDHFVPWSYVAHDEMWNLSPTTRAINSSKSNNLPDWDIYFNKLVELEYNAYSLMWRNDKVHDRFNECAKEHINSDEIRWKVYRKGLGRDEFEQGLKSIILPVYQSAENCGFRGEWRI